MTAGNAGEPWCRLPHHPVWQASAREADITGVVPVNDGLEMSRIYVVGQGKCPDKCSAILSVGMVVVVAGLLRRRVELLVPRE